MRNAVSARKRSWPITSSDEAEERSESHEKKLHSSERERGLLPIDAGSFLCASLVR